MSAPPNIAPRRPPLMYRPHVGRSWCRSYTSQSAADQYADGWRHPEQYEPAACGTPAQQGALDRIMESK